MGDKKVFAGLANMGRNKDGMVLLKILLKLAACTQ